MGATVKGTLKFGLKIDGAVHKEFELRLATAEDMFAAEQMVPPSQPLAYNGEVMCRQLLRIGSFNGPFTLAHIKKLRAADYSILRQAQMESDELGEE